MNHHDELTKRISLVRRDLGNLLFHFTRKPEHDIEVIHGTGKTIMGDHASSVLHKILMEGKILGSSYWIRGGYKCVCFTESPITELAAIFSLTKIAADKNERPRYEPFGIAVTKEWLFSKGGRPVIYQPESEFKLLHEKLRYRHVRYEIDRGIDHTWEREWRIQTDELVLDPKKTLVIVPTADDAYDITYGYSEPEPDGYGSDGIPMGVYHKPKWMAVSLDLFGLHETEY